MRTSKLTFTSNEHKALCGELRCEREKRRETPKIIINLKKTREFAIAATI